jgi:hypothetical protein
MTELCVGVCGEPIPASSHVLPALDVAGIIHTKVRLCIHPARAASGDSVVLAVVPAGA